MTLTDKLEQMAGRLDAAGSLLAIVAEADARDAELVREIRRLEQAKLPDDEIESCVRTWAAGRGQRTRLEYGGTLLSIFGDPTRHQSSMSLPPGLSELDLRCAGDADAIAAEIMAVIRKVPHESGLPAAERPAQLAAKKAERQALGEAREKLVDEALVRGIMIQHRPDVVRRRENEARLRELDEQQTADALARHAAIDRAYAEATGPGQAKPRTPLINPAAERRTGGQSQYLATGKLSP